MRRMMLLAPLALCVLIAAVLSCTPSAMPSYVALAPTPSTQAMVGTFAGVCGHQPLSTISLGFLKPASLPENL